jgi:hypothetical protein
VAPCSPLSVNIRHWPEAAAFSSPLTMANSRESRRIPLFGVKLWSIGLCLGERFWPGGAGYSADRTDDRAVGGIHEQGIMSQEAGVPGSFPLFADVRIWRKYTGFVLRRA